MAKLNYNPKMYGTVTNVGDSSYVPKNELLFSNETQTNLNPKTMIILSSNFQIGTKLNNVMPIVDCATKTEADFIVFGIIDNPTNKKLHNQIDVDIDVHKKQYVNNTLMTDIQVERVGKRIDKDTTVVGYPSEIHPFLTYNFTCPEHVKINPFITYNVSHGITIDDIPFLTYIDYDFGGKNRQKIYYLVLYNKFMDKIVRCKMYDDTQGFPIQNVHLTMACSDGKHRYIPLNHVNEDFDSGARCQDKFGHIFQICTGRQDSIINKYFPFGNMIIPLDSYENLYTILVGIFGTARVSMGEDKKSVYFSPPSSRAGITKMFLIGLNIRITTEYDYELTTYDNGLNHTSFGGDYHKVANAMLIKMNSREKFKIEFDDNYSGMVYPTDAPVKNAIVLGTTVEALNESCDNYIALVRSNKWFIYNTETNYINIVDSTNKIVSYFKKNYLKYTNSKEMYNYFDLQKMKYEYDKFGKVLNK